MIYLLLIVSIAVDQDEYVSIADLIKDAQISNAAHLNQGKFRYNITYTIGDKEPIHFESTFFWKSDNAFWAYKYSDPENSISRNHEQLLEESPVHYRFIYEDIFYAYSYIHKKIFVDKPEHRNSYSTAYFLFDVFPETNWSRCCQPYHSSGRPWTEIIGPNSPVVSPGDTSRFDRIDAQTYRLVREYSDGGLMEVDFSLDLAGSPTFFRGTAGPGSRSQSKTIRYQWERQDGGAVVLRGCEATWYGKGGSDEVVEVYKLEIDEVDVETPVPDSRFRLATLAKMVPPDTLVSNHITNESYYVDPSFQRSTTDQLDSLSEKLRKRGFLGGGKKEDQP